jgi:folate-dependent phosphoribosylglycinamide formyltransferase PurN
LAKNLMKKLMSARVMSAPYVLRDAQMFFLWDYDGKCLGPMGNTSKRQLRIVLLTRTGRPSGEKILKTLATARKGIIAVVAEKRSSLLLKKGILHFIRDSITKHGFFFLWEKAWDLFRSFVGGKKDFLRNVCQEHNIPLFAVDDHNSLLTVDILKSLKPDLLITANTRVIKENVLRIPQKAAINFHTSKLPQYAGLDSIFWALYHGEKEIGVTIHYLAEGLDTGDIIVQEAIPVNAEDDLVSLAEKANNLGSQLVLEAVDKLERGDSEQIPQDLARRSYFSWPTPSQRNELRRKMNKRKT